jgi:predicted AlkP superfamily phosphohydrolase/phosphomutase
MWEISSHHGKKSIVMNIPMTYPPKKIDGMLVSGLDAPSLDCEFTYPPELKAELLHVVPDYKINLHLGGYLSSNKRRQKAIQIMSSCIRAREKAVLYLMEKKPWDLFAVRFNSPDNVQHQFWKFMDENHPFHDPDSPPELKNAIYDIYEELDRVAASVLAKLPEDCVLIVMSDHGAGPRTNKTIRLNEWLESLGFLESKATKKRGKAAIYKTMEKALSSFLKRVPPELKQWIAKVAPGAVSKTWTYFRFPNIDWKKTKAFVGETEGIRLNLKGRYPEGIVNESEYDSLREYLIEQVKILKDPETGESIFQKVKKREEAFDGPYLEEFPDIIAITTKDQYNISSKMGDETGKQGKQSFVAEEKHWRQVNGSHRKEGVFVMWGKDIKKNLKLSTSEIVDVCPTTLYLLGLPIPTDMDGRVVAEAFEPAYLEAYPVKYDQVEERGVGKPAIGDQYDEDEKEKLVDHLKGLGYID